MHHLPHYLMHYRQQGARWLAAGLLALAAPLASATVLGFDDGYGTLLAPGDSVLESGWRVTAEGTDGAGLVGAVLDGNDYYVCSTMLCPYNAVGNYYAAVNDGSVLLDRTETGGAFRLAGFAASFIGTSYDGAYDGLVGMLLLTGRDASGASLQEMVGLYAALDVAFVDYGMSAAFASHDFTSVTLTAFGCDTIGNCIRNNNQAQFALDSIDVSASAMPEPASYAMLLAGLALVTVLARRRNRNATGRTL